MEKNLLKNVTNVTLGMNNQFSVRLMGGDGDDTHPEDNDYNGGSSYDGW